MTVSQTDGVVDPTRINITRFATRIGRPQYQHNERTKQEHIFFTRLRPCRLARGGLFQAMGGRPVGCALILQAIVGGQYGTTVNISNVVFAARKVRAIEKLIAVKPDITL